MITKMLLTKKIIYLPILFCIIFFSSTNAQIINHSIIFRGIVKNTEGKVLEKVIASEKYKNQNLDQSLIYDGTFTITIEDTTQLDHITFSYLGYTSFKINASELLLFFRKNPNSFYTVILKEIALKLNEVEVASDKLIPFYQKENVSISDYDIMVNGNLLIIMEYNGIEKIVLLNQQDSILKMINNIYAITEIVKGCSGRYFLKSKKLLYPTSITDTDILISNNPVEINSSLDQINQIVACDTKIKIKENVSSFNQQIRYTLQLVADPAIKKNIYLAQDVEQIKGAKYEKDEIDGEVVPNRMGDIWIDDMKQIWAYDKKVWKYEYYSIKKLYAPLFLFRDSIYIFDHAIDSIIIIAYKQIDTTLVLKELRRTPLFYNKKKGWQKIILQDIYTRDFYTLYKNDKIILENIPLFSTVAEKNIPFPREHYFADKIKIYNHRVYYLWKDRSKGYPICSLFKLNI